MNAERLRLRLVRAFDVAQEERWATDLPPTRLKEAHPEALIRTSFHHGYVEGLELALTILNEENVGEER